jgi:hypothetical protein
MGSLMITWQYEGIPLCECNSLAEVILVDTGYKYGAQKRYFLVQCLLGACNTNHLIDRQGEDYYSHLQYFVTTYEDHRTTHARYVRGKMPRKILVVR